MSDCERFQEQLSALLDGELSAGEEAEVRAHMADCPDCRAMYEAFAAASAAVAAQDVPDTLHEGIMAKVRAAEKAGRTQGVLIRLRPILAAAACLIVLVGTVFALKNTIGFRGAKSSGAAPTEAASAAAPMAPDIGAAGAAPASTTESAPSAKAASSDSVLFDSKLQTPAEPIAPKPAPGQPAPQAAESTNEAIAAGSSGVTATEVVLPYFTMRLEERTDAGLVGVVTDAGTQTLLAEGERVTVLPNDDAAAENEDRGGAREGALLTVSLAPEADLENGTIRAYRIEAAD